MKLIPFVLSKTEFHAISSRPVQRPHLSRPVDKGDIPHAANKHQDAEGRLVVRGSAGLSTVFDNPVTGEQNCTTFARVERWLAQVFVDYGERVKEYRTAQHTG